MARIYRRRTRLGQKYFWKIQAFAPDGKLMSDGKTHAFRITAIKSVNFDEVKMRVNKTSREEIQEVIFLLTTQCLSLTGGQSRVDSAASYRNCG